MEFRYIHLFDTQAEHDEAYSYSGGTYEEPWVAYTEATDTVTFNKPYAQRYLTTTALEDGTITFNIYKSIGTEYITSISYSVDEGKTWVTTQNQDNKEQNIRINVDVETGDKVMWKGAAIQTGIYDNNEGDYVGSFFSSDCEFDADGNVMSLLYGDNFVGEETIENDGAFTWLFSDYNEEFSCGIANASNLVLPATTLATNCYYGMFCGCTSLTSAPELPATTLVENCYGSMFYGCTSLTTAPELPATTLANSCYYMMFQDCTSLMTTPVLPATTLVQNCYGSMFQGCTSLTTAPELPVTTLAISCYYMMFKGCTSLTTAPELPATTLAISCYRSMFQGCTNLNYIKAMFTTTPSSTYTGNWVSGVAASGTFVKNSAAQWNVSGVNGVPNGWTVQTASE